MSERPRYVYGLVSGSYSDYGVHAIYSTYEAAAAEAARLNALLCIDKPNWTNCDDCEVQAFVLDPTTDQLIAEGAVEVHITDTGDVVEPALHHRGLTGNPFAPPRVYTVYLGQGIPDERRFVGYGIDAERARRAADEYRCMVLMAEQPTT